MRIVECETRNSESRIDQTPIRGHDSEMKQPLQERTKLFALDIIRFISGLRMNRIYDVLSRQLLKGGTSIGANYREASRAESHDDFIHKIEICAKEAAETQYWLELFLEGGLADDKNCERLQQEASELLAIFVASGRTARGRR